MTNSKLDTVKNPDSSISESYRILGTNIQFSSLDKKMNTLVVTSTKEGEGKSTVASNLSVVLAENEKKTILIDCDLRNPKIHEFFELSNEYGISDVLAEEVNFYDTVNSTEISNLYVLTAGTKLKNPSKVLGTIKMKELIKKLKDEYEYIIIDTPPVIMATDAQLLAQYADGCIFVVSSREVDREAAIQAKLLLEKVNVKILGVVLNKVDTSNRVGKNNYYYGKKKNKLINRILSRLKILKLK